MDIKIVGLKELREAIKRNPQKVVVEVRKFLASGIIIYNNGIIRSPWRVGGSGGGAPVAKGDLRDKHRKEVSPWQAKIIPFAPHAKYVHDGTRFMTARPWLDHVQQSSDPAIQKLQDKLLENIVNDLAK